MSLKLRAFDHDGAEVVDSREVAKLVEKQHKNLLRDITGYIKVMEESTELKIEPSDFFIPSTYEDSTGRTLPCYLLALQRQGCGPAERDPERNLNTRGFLTWQTAISRIPAGTSTSIQAT